MGARLVINADDFAYFDGVSQGILDAIAAGTVTATGVMANAPAFERWARALLAFPQVDVGVHLNITHGQPLTTDVDQILVRNTGHFVDKALLTVRAMTGTLPVKGIAAEWRAQIERCKDSGLQIRFLNSHEHVHMLPRLYSIVVALAREYEVPFVRYATPDPVPPAGVSGQVRALLLRIVGQFQSALPNTPEFLGFGPSGRLGMRYVETILPRLRSEAAYELMCHPGRGDIQASADPRLKAYHDWTGELALLLSAEFRAALSRNAVQLARFRDLAAG